MRPTRFRSLFRPSASIAPRSSRLGGRDSFIAEFEAAGDDAGSDGDWLREMRNGGVFFTLSGELLDCWHVTASPLISFSPSLRMAVWLWDRLRNAGLLL